MTISERDTWTFAYRLYDEIAPLLRQAAAMNDNNETAGKIFCDVIERCRVRYDAQDHGGRLILLGVIDILDGVFKEAQKTVEKRLTA